MSLLVRDDVFKSSVEINFRTTSITGAAQQALIHHTNVILCPAKVATAGSKGFAAFADKSGRIGLGDTHQSAYADLLVAIVSGMKSFYRMSGNIDGLEARPLPWSAKNCSFWNDLASIPTLAEGFGSDYEQLAMEHAFDRFELELAIRKAEETQAPSQAAQVGIRMNTIKGETLALALAGRGQGAGRGRVK